jgi:hypothetical protein
MRAMNNKKAKPSITALVSLYNVPGPIGDGAACLFGPV